MSTIRTAVGTEKPENAILPIRIFFKILKVWLKEFVKFHCQGKKLLPISEAPFISVVPSATWINQFHGISTTISIIMAAIFPFLVQIIMLNLIVINMSWPKPMDWSSLESKNLVRSFHEFFVIENNNSCFYFSIFAFTRCRKIWLSSWTWKCF